MNSTVDLIDKSIRVQTLREDNRILESRIERMFNMFFTRYNLVLELAIKPVVPADASNFSWTFFIERMQEIHNKSLFTCVSIRQRLDKLNLKPQLDYVSSHFSSFVAIEVATNSNADTVAGSLYNEKSERKMIDDFNHKIAVNHEKVRRQTSSLQRESDANRCLLLQRQEQVVELGVHIRDVRSEVLTHFAELEKQRKRMKKWKMSYEKVHKNLSDLQSSFNFSTISPESLDGMRRNIYRLLSDNRDLSNQMVVMTRQSHFYEIKLMAVREELRQTRSLLHEREQAAASALASSNERFALTGTSITPRVSLGFIEPHGPYPLTENSKDLEKFYADISANPSNPQHAANTFLRTLASHSSAESARLNTRILDSAGHEFFWHWKQAQSLFALSEALQHMASIRDLDKAVKFVMTAICRLCECDRASYWVIDRSRGMAWTKVAPSQPNRDDRRKSGDTDAPASSMNTIMIPLSTGLVGAAYRSGQVLNIADAYADDRFNRTVDQKTEYRTRSVLCYPVILHGQVVGITQCINKVSPSNSVFSETDIAIVKTLGSAMLSVLSSCHQHEESQKLAARRQVLVGATDDLIRRMTCRRQLLMILRDRMRSLFRADECALILVYKDFFARVSLELDQTLSLVSADRDPFNGDGLIHRCVESQQDTHAFGKKEIDIIPLCPADIEILRRPYSDPSHAGMSDGDMSVHTWPLLSSSRPGEVSAVIQWACMKRSVIGFGDDGSFNEKNAAHVDLCSRFMRLISFHVERFWPSKYRLSWTKAKHLQLKVRGMLSFTSAKDDSIVDDRKTKVRFTPFVKQNQRVFERWMRARDAVMHLLSQRRLEAKHAANESKSVSRPAVDFKEKLLREQQKRMARRPTVSILKSSAEEIRAIAEASSSPFARGRLNSNKVFGNLLAHTETQKEDEPAESGTSSESEISEDHE